MKTKDALIGLLLWFLIIAVIFFVGAVDSLPKWTLVILAIIAWIAYILVAIRDHVRWKRRRPLFYIKKDKEWLAIDRDGEVMPGVYPPYQRANSEESQK